MDQLQRDLALTGDTHNKLTGQIHDLEKENAICRGKVEEITHKNKVDLTNLKMEMLKQRGELERERDKLLNVVDGRCQTENLYIKLCTKVLVHVNCTLPVTVNEHVYVCVCYSE